jgi:hypothetical protein
MSAAFSECVLIEAGPHWHGEQLLTAMATQR